MQCVPHVTNVVPMFYQFFFYIMHHLTLFDISQSAPTEALVGIVNLHVPLDITDGFVDLLVSVTSRSVIT